MDILRRALLAILFVASTGAVAAGQEETTLTTQAARLDSEGARQPAQVTSRFAADFATFAGSQENAEALITGLRTGSPITLTSVSPAGTVTSTTITPPTRPMGYGNTYTSVSVWPRPRSPNTASASPRRSSCRRRSPVAASPSPRWRRMAR